MIRWKSRKAVPPVLRDVVLSLPVNFPAMKQVWTAIWEATDEDRPFTMLPFDKFLSERRRHERTRPTSA